MVAISLRVMVCLHDVWRGSSAWCADNASTPLTTPLLILLLVSGCSAAQETPFPLAPAPLPQLFRSAFRSERLPLAALSTRLTVHTSAAAAAAAAAVAAAATPPQHMSSPRGSAQQQGQQQGQQQQGRQFVCQFAYDHRTTSLGMAMLQ